MYTAMTREQRRFVENIRSTTLEYGVAARARDEFAGGMQWITVKGREYLSRYRRDPVTGEQKATSLGPRSPSTQSWYVRFMTERSELDGRLGSLRPEMAEQARMAKALRLNRAPEDVGAIARAIGMSDLINHVVLTGDGAVFAYECEMTSLLPREMLPDGEIEFMLSGVDATDAVGELTAVLRRARIEIDSSVKSNGGLVELRTEDGLRIRLTSVTAVERLVDQYAEEDIGGGEAARWALEMDPMTSILIDRQGRAAPVSVPDPRAWCIMRCMALDMEKMSVIRTEATSELVTTMIKMVQERWPQPFDDERVSAYGRLHEALHGGDFIPPPRL